MHPSNIFCGPAAQRVAFIVAFFGAHAFYTSAFDGGDNHKDKNRRIIKTVSTDVNDEK